MEKSDWCEECANKDTEHCQQCSGERFTDPTWFEEVEHDG
jgi:hypothetical protein